MVIFDPKMEQTLSKSIALSRSDYCAYEGLRFGVHRGWSFSAEG